MGRGATKAKTNVYYQARIEAAKWNDRLCSREGAAEALGVSVDTVKNIELGLHKCVPVDLVVLMSDLYNAPYLLSLYCKKECPIGCNYPIATAMTPVERTTLKLINLLDPGKLEDVKRELISIAEDGEITEDEIPSLKEILDYADKLILSATELKMLIKKKVQLDVDVELGYNEIFNWIIFCNDPEMLRRLGKLALRTAYDIEHPQDDDFRSRA